MAHTDFERMVIEELKSIETGATEPIAYIDANHYTQHNLGVADGLAGFGAALSDLYAAGRWKSMSARTVTSWRMTAGIFRQIDTMLS